MPSLVSWKKYNSTEGHFVTFSRIFSVSAKELKLTVSAIKGHRLALNHVFILSGMDIALDRLSFECSVASRGPTHLGKSDRQNGACLWL